MRFPYLHPFGYHVPPDLTAQAGAVNLVTSARINANNAISAIYSAIGAIYSAISAIYSAIGAIYSAIGAIYSAIYAIYSAILSIGNNGTGVTPGPSSSPNGVFRSRGTKFLAGIKDLLNAASPGLNPAGTVKSTSNQGTTGIGPVYSGSVSVVHPSIQA